MNVCYDLIDYKINIQLAMNGLHITGMKLSSPTTTTKKAINNTTTNLIKPKQPTVNKTLTKKTTVPPPAVQKAPIVQKKQPVKKVEQKIVKKQEPKKVETKKQQAVKKEQKVQQIKVKQEEKVVEAPPTVFQVMLRYNHYKEKFQCINGVLSFAVPNQKYCFGLVFKGNYQPVVRNFKTREIIQPLTQGKAQQFSWKVDESQVYEVQIQQDEQQQSKYQRHVYKAPQKKQCPMKKNQRAQDLTQQMKKMGVDQLGSAKHKQMLEQRDLQDILFG